MISTMRKRRKLFLLLSSFVLVGLVVYLMTIGAKGGAGAFIGGTKGRFLSFVRSGISTQDRLDTADLLGFNDRSELLSALVLRQFVGRKLCVE